MHTYIARQPIFDRKAQIYAYELLFRNNVQETSYTSANADQASSRVVMGSFQTMGLDSVTGGRPAFVNFTAKLLLDGIATLFPKDLLVIEVLENIEPTPEIIEVCRDLCRSGYTIALDDFIYRPALEPLIELCKVIKFDFLACTPQEIGTMLGKMDVRGKLLLAEKIENKETFDQAVDLGFTLFQGYFLSKPITVMSKEIAPLKTNYMSLLKETNEAGDINFQRISQIIQGDVALSYKLLRMVNSAFYGMSFQVTDIRHSLAVLGTQELRKWVFLMALMGLNSEKPNELVRVSMIRGRFMEQLGPKAQLPYHPDNIYLVGLFSLIDELLEQPMDVALSGVVLPGEVREALEEQKGPLYKLLCLAITMEKGHWEEVDKLAAELTLDSQEISSVYLDTIKWCDDIIF